MNDDVLYRDCRLQSELKSGSERDVQDRGRAEVS